MKIIEKNGKYAIVRKKWFFFNDYWCPEWQGWIGKTHYLFNKCFVSYNDCLRNFKYMNICSKD